ncbi:MAG: hypothetical protein RLZZ28_812 [Bacteroidota bacterium]
MNKLFSAKHLLAGLLVGTLDITAASIQYFIKTGKNPSGVLRYVASGAFGSDAFTGGNAMLVWGLVFHFMIALCFSFLFFWLTARLPALLNYKIATACVYGILMWSAMKYLVLPFSKIPASPFNLANAAIAIAILVICIALPLASIAGKRSAD